MTDADIIDGIIQREGGYVDDPADKGGPTKFGITQRTLAEWRRYHVVPGDVEAMTIDEARAIYRHRYIDEPGLAAVKPDGLRALLVDIGVMSGPVQAVKTLQRVLGIQEDGVFGSQTLTALVAGDPAIIYRGVVAERMRFFGKIIPEDNNAKFAGGWLNRLAEFAEKVA